MNNADLAARLQALFPIEDINLRVEIVSLLKAILQAERTRSKSTPHLHGFEHLNFFIKDSINQPLLKEALFPGQSLKESRQEFLGITSGSEPTMSEIYSMLAKNLLLDNINMDPIFYSNEDLLKIEDDISTPEKRTFIWELMNQKDADEIIQTIHEILEIRTEVSPSDSVSGLTDSEGASEITETLDESKPSAASSVPDSIPAPIRSLIHKEGYILHTQLDMLIYSGLNSKITPQERNSGIETLRFIYNELQKTPHDRICAFQNIIDSTTKQPIQKSQENLLCRAAANKLKRFFNAEVEEKANPTQNFRKKITSMQDGNSSKISTASHKDKETLVPRFDSRK